MFIKLPREQYKIKNKNRIGKFENGLNDSSLKTTPLYSHINCFANQSKIIIIAPIYSFDMPRSASFHYEKINTFLTHNYLYASKKLL